MGKRSHKIVKGIKWDDISKAMSSVSGKYSVLNKCSLLPVGIKFTAIVVDISIFSLPQFSFPWFIKKKQLREAGAVTRLLTSEQWIVAGSWFMFSYSSCVWLDHLPWYYSISDCKNFPQKVLEAQFLRPNLQHRI